MSRIIIIGAGQAAAWAAHTLRAEGYSGVLAVVSNEEAVFYERPPLSKQVLAGEMAVAGLQLFDEAAIAAMNIEWHKPDTVTAINRADQTVTLASGTVLAYTQLLLATGSRARLPVPAWADMPNVFTVRTIADAENLGQKLQPGKRMAIIGGGWIGLEVAATARKKGLAVTVLEHGSRLCKRSVSPEVSAFLLNLHEAAGTAIQLDSVGLSLLPTDMGTVQIRGGSSLLLEADVVVVGAGAEIATELAVAAGLEVRDGVVVDASGRTSDPHIFAAGDVAIHPELGFCIQSWANAQNQAICAAKNMLGQGCDYAEIPWLWSDQLDCNIQILGNPGAEGLQLVVRDVGPNKKTFIYVDEAQRLQAMVAVNEARLIKLGKRWMQAGMVLPLAQLADPEFNPMSLKP
ncbi:MAG: FAD-dependent oxidoreductase [Neisseriaceae bacterium]|nr:FAD-dependent oxidoreductase [Neisseriaceae bacterium]MBP6861670.1 FAD-dependent oxidoreductase [Neisseriaceae bacterium]